MERELCAELEVALVPYEGELERDERIETERETLEPRPLTLPLTLSLER
ncbi:MAG TPA: hypothetical protein VJR89_29940 [Polyangiales bacterium]|nr:hypothetical protein [Polyangiales bacterium]